eukprot:scaffold284656_cov28-Tisochrysis_lutea.AAC.1
MVNGHGDKHTSQHHRLCTMDKEAQEEDMPGNNSGNKQGAINNRSTVATNNNAVQQKHLKPEAHADNEASKKTAPRHPWIRSLLLGSHERAGASSLP